MFVCPVLGLTTRGSRGRILQRFSAIHHDIIVPTFSAIRNDVLVPIFSAIRHDVLVPIFSAIRHDVLVPIFSIHHDVKKPLFSRPMLSLHFLGNPSIAMLVVSSYLD